MSFFYLLILSLLSIFTCCNPTENNYWLRGEFLHWRLKPDKLSVPIITSGSLLDELPGALGQQNTGVVLGCQQLYVPKQHGVRITAGSWVNCKNTLGLEAIYIRLTPGHYNRSISTTGERDSANLAVPIFDPTGSWGLNGIPGETIALFTGPLFGMPGFQAQFDFNLTQKLQGFEFNLLESAFCSHHIECQFITGMRWLQLRENLTFTGNTHTAKGSPIPTSFYNFQDRFNTTNNFYGAQIGLQAQYTLNSCALEAIVKCNLGAVKQQIAISGTSQTTDGNLFFLIKSAKPAHLFGGIFAQPSNSGTRTEKKYAVLLESGIRAHYYITQHIDLHIGYNKLWLSRAIRPAQLIDRRVNPTFTNLAMVSRQTVGVGSGPIPFGEPGAAPQPQGSKVPVVELISSGIWARGITLGLTITF